MSMTYEATVACMDCGFIFRAYVRSGSEPGADHLFQTRCPINGSICRFTGAELRAVEQHDPHAMEARQVRLKAILSDIHGNLEALEAVLNDVARYGLWDIYCLGDLVGYGPNPRECVDLAMQWKVVLMGNFELAVQRDPPDLGSAIIATRSTVYARQELNSPSPDAAAAGRRWAFLRGLPKSHEEADTLFVHGSPSNPLNEYLVPEDIYNPRKMRRNFPLVRRFCFNGHTHVPGIWVEQGTDAWMFVCPADLSDGLWWLGGRKTICNVGSVGQPRDGDWRACYALFDGYSARFRRVLYDVDDTVKKIYANPELENFLGDRLREGK